MSYAEIILGSLRLSRWPLRVSAAGMLAVLGACGGGGGGGGSPPPPTYSIGGTLSGLSASGLVLANGADTTSPLSGATTYTFSTMLASGASYSVSVKTQPTGETCNVTAGSGTVASANVSVAVACTVNMYTLGGTVNGLTGSGLTLLNGTVTVPVTAGATTFSFPAQLSYGTAYAVTVKTQPTGQTCQISSGSGAVGTSTATVVVSCAGPQWTWLGGSMTPNASTNYGTLGVAAPGNVPGARAASVSWSDSASALWMFGGYGNEISGGVSGSGYLNDLWKYDPLAGLWTWEGGSNSGNSPGTYGTLGSPSSANIPGGRNYATSWVDATGSVWVFGGVGFSAAPGSSAYLNDLWKYNPSNGSWAWVSGSDANLANSTNVKGTYGVMGTAAPGNVPGSRAGAAAWVDGAGALWLFGGYGYDSVGTLGELNDLWKFDPTLAPFGQWAWVGGANTASAAGIYTGPGAFPGARRWPVVWTDSNHIFWLFGGEGYDSAGAFGALSDLWKYNPGTKAWTFVGGMSTGKASGVYGLQGIAAPGNAPGARSQAVGWSDNAGTLWMYGGNGYDSVGTLSSLNDLWKYDATANLWTWVNGAKTADAAGVYGTQGIAAPTNSPGARQVAITWVQANNTLWLFGGYGFDATGASQYYLSDLWFVVPQ